VVETEKRWRGQLSGCCWGPPPPRALCAGDRATATTPRKGGEAQFTACRPVLGVCARNAAATRGSTAGVTTRVLLVREAVGRGGRRMGERPRLPPCMASVALLVSMLNGPLLRLLELPLSTCSLLPLLCGRRSSAMSLPLLHASSITSVSVVAPCASAADASTVIP